MLSGLASYPLLQWSSPVQKLPQQLSSRRRLLLRCWQGQSRLWW
jgi:hypothetical protein